MQSSAAFGVVSKSAGLFSRRTSAGEALFAEEASELLRGLDRTDGRQLLSISKQIGLNLMERPSCLRT